MKTKAVSGIMLALLLISMLTLAFNIQRAESTTRIVPDDYPTIQAAINAADPGDIIQVASGIYPEDVTANKPVTLVGENSSTTIINGSGAPYGYLVHVTANYVNIINFTIQNGTYRDGIYLSDSSYSTIVGNIMTNNFYGIFLDGCNGTTISGNAITDNQHGIRLRSSSGNIISGNTVSNSNWGIHLYIASKENIISGNTISDNNDGVYLASSCDSNTIYQNNFINNTSQAYDAGINLWDDGYPSGGNYWSDYNGTDLYSGPYQNVTGSDGIGDTPYYITGTVNAQDEYPLMYIYTGHDVAVKSVKPSKTVVGQGFSLTIDVNVTNIGSFPENFNVIIYANTTVIATPTNITLTSGNSTTITLTWNTAAFPYGNYTISANATVVPDETDTTDNTLIDGWVLVTVVGDANGDCIASVADMVQVDIAIGTEPGEPNYNPNADVNCNGMISVADMVLIDIHLDETC